MSAHTCAHNHTWMHTHRLPGLERWLGGQVSTRDLLPLLWIQVTEGHGVEGVVSPEEEPVAHASDKQLALK